MKSWRNCEYLNMHLDDGLADERGAEECPEWHEEMAARDARQVKQRVWNLQHRNRVYPTRILNTGSTLSPSYIRLFILILRNKNRMTNRSCTHNIYLRKSRYFSRSSFYTMTYEWTFVSPKLCLLPALKTYTGLKVYLLEISSKIKGNCDVTIQH